MTSPSSPPVQARAAYRDVALLIAAGSGHSLWATVMIALREHATIQVPHSGLVGRVLMAVGAIAMAGWLIRLTAARKSGSAWALAGAAALAAAVAADAAGLVPADGGGTSGVLAPLAGAGLTVWLVREILRHHGVRLHASAGPADADTQGGVFAAALLGFAAAGLAMVTVSLWFPQSTLGGHQLEAGGITTGSQAFAAFVWTAVAEELAETAAVLALLGAAGRPVREAVALCLLLRLAGHAYLGAAAVAAVVAGAVAVLLFLRYRTVLPLLLAHFTWDAKVRDWVIPQLYAVDTGDGTRTALLFASWRTSTATLLLTAGAALWLLHFAQPAASGSQAGEPDGNGRTSPPAAALPARRAP
ncbi:CPBP family glutamic-type intramembrane protease [Streptomyces aidingensis]|uniref:CAAX protease self-immunity n=1 Tax=Streptomyces aidingensis TaxID=910347 RepID=A0A1I1U2S2_9ACTN|nr:CPBP family glutamic-type intramembrane protease [Streptomyces aidingensis]SFD65117.1 CAAX protease self-immunity [Streptomyces aidingensis]